MHLVIICNLVLSFGTHRVENLLCLWSVYHKTLAHPVDLLTQAPSLSSVYQDFVFVVHISGIFAESWSLVNSPTDSWNPDLFCLLAPGLTRKVCQIILFHGDLVRKEQCTSVCTRITPVLLLTLYLVRIRAACVTVNLLLVLWETVPPSSLRDHSVSFGGHEM